MKAKDLIVMAGAALAVWAMLNFSRSGQNAAPQYWATAQGNTGFPDEARTGSGGGVWI